MNSTLFNLNATDLVKGLVLAVLTTVLTIVYDIVQSGSLVFDWKHIATAAITTAIAYLLKNFLSNSSGKILKKEN
jgi:putative exporter of polyketide antibiotics